MAKTKEKPVPVAGAAPNGNHRPEKYSGPRQRTIRVDQIVILAGHNARKDVGDVGELAESIAEIGLLEPLVVEPGSWNSAMKDYITWHLVAGERRLTAVKQLKWKEVDVVVRDLGERERILAMLAENLSRDDLDPLEEASGYRRAVDAGFHQKEIAKKVGRSEAHISKRLALLQLPEQVHARISKGDITLGDALELAKLVDHPTHLDRVLERTGRYHYSGYAGAVRDELDMVKKASAMADARRGLEQRGIPIVKEAELGYGVNFGQKERPLAGQHRDWEEIGVSIKQHEGEPCHAAVIDGVGQVIYVCTDPKRHADVDAKSKRALDAKEQRQAELRKNKQRKLEGEARVEVATKVLAAPLEQHVQFIADQVARVGTHDECRVTCEILGLEPEKKGYFSPSFEAALRKHAAASKKGAWQVLMAVAMARPEIELRSQWSGASEQNKAYRDLLGAAGYVKPKLPTAAAPKASAKKDGKAKATGKPPEDAEQKRLREQRLQADREAFPDESQPSVDEAIATAIETHETKTKGAAAPEQHPAGAVRAGDGTVWSRGPDGGYVASGRDENYLTLRALMECEDGPFTPVEGGGVLPDNYQPKCRKCGRTEADGLVFVELLGGGKDLCSACDGGGE